MVTAKKAAIGLSVTAALVGIIWQGYGLIERIKGAVDQIRVAASFPKFGKPSLSGLPITVPVAIDNKSSIQATLNNLYITIIGIPASGPNTEIAVSGQTPSLVIRANSNNNLPVNINLTIMGGLSLLINRGFKKIRVRTYFEYKGVPKSIDYDIESGVFIAQIKSLPGISQLLALIKPQTTQTALLNNNQPGPSPDNVAGLLGMGNINAVALY